MLRLFELGTRFSSYGAEFDLHPEETETDGGDAVLRYSALGIFLILLVAALSLAKVIAMPVLAGLVFGLVLGPTADRLNRIGMPQALAALVIVLAGIAVFAGCAAILAVPLASWSDQAPAMLAALRNASHDLFQTLETAEQFVNSLTAAPAAIAPAQVVLKDNAAVLSMAMTSGSVAGALLLFIGTVYFYLATRRSIKAHALRLCLGRAARRSAGEFFDLLEDRIASYFGIVAVINVGLGVVAGLIAWSAGMPYPIFWGAFAAFMNFMAFLGPLIVTVAFFAAGLVGHTTLAAALWPAGAFLLAHGIESQFVTPGMVGRRLTISPILVFLSIAFWLWLWGPVGAFLATPFLLVAAVFVEVRAHYRLLRDSEEQPAPSSPKLALAQVT